MTRLALAAALAAVIAAPAALFAQDRPPRDTIVILPRGQQAEAAEEEEAPAADTLRLDAEGRPARRPARRPFEVRSSGRAAPHGPPRDVVWMHRDSIRRARGADADSAAADTVHADSIAMARADDGDAAEDDDENVVVLDVSGVGDERPARRRGTDEEDAPASRRRNADDADAPTTTRRRSAEADDEGAETPPRRTSSRTPGRDSTAAPRRTTRTTERADTASTRRATRAAARDTAGARRTTSRDTASTRRATGSTSARTASGRPRTHTVASGETFFGIARRYGVTSAQLRALNPGVDWERLPVGTELRLPAGARNPAQSGQRAAASPDDDERPAQRPATQPARGRRTHTVAQGETLFGIARRYGVTVDAIRQANELEGDRVRIGQTLAIPRAPQR